MKKNNLLLIIVSIVISQMTHSQETQQHKVEKLTHDLNNRVAPNFILELKKNKAFCTVDTLSKILDLRNSYEIAEDTMSNKTKVSLYSGRYVGPVFWKYDFQTATNSKVLFKFTKNQQIFCKILFKEQDTITLKSKLNAYTSHHKTSDAALHKVQWLGDKYISLLLTPKWVDNKIEMEVRGITVSGKFQRRDAKLIDKYYSKKLRKIFRREFEKLFESEEMTKLLSQKIKP